MDIDDDLSTLAEDQVENTRFSSRWSAVNPSFGTVETFTDGSQAQTVKTHSSGFSLRRKSSLIENEIDSTILISNQKRRTSQLLRTSTASMAMNKLQFSKLELIGREKEMNILQESFDRVVARSTDSDCGKEFMLISGYSGTGKTALADSLRQQVELLDGAFVVGKFDLGSGGEPYSGIKVVCREICGILLMEGSGSTVVQHVRETMVDELGKDLIPLLLNLVPDLEDILTPSYERVYTSYSSNRPSMGTSNQEQLKYVFRLFFRIVCSQYKPLVIVLDDLQWADEGSLDIIEVLLTDGENNGLMLIGCYRSNEVDEKHIFAKVLRELKSKSNKEQIEGGDGFNTTELEIGNLDSEQVEEVVAKLLSMDKSNKKELGRAKQLGGICFKRTQGNAFFLISFLMLLQREKYLTFNFGSFRWNWDCNVIEAETSSTENIVELMMGKITNVNSDLKQLLKIAALLGSQFDEKILFTVWKSLHEGDDVPDDNFLAGCLSQAVEESFLENTGPSTFRWVHDKIQDAALSLVPEEDRSTFQFDVGLILLRKLDEKELGSLIFVMVTLLDSKICDDDATNYEIAELSAAATKKARELSAFISTRKYAGIGIKHLASERKWETHPDLVCQLHSAAAEAESFLGNYDAMHLHCDEVLDNCMNFEDKIPVLLILEKSLCKRGKFDEGRHLCKDTIKELGVASKFPSKMAMGIMAIVGLLRNKKLLISLDVDKLPIVSDLKQIATMKLLDGVCNSCYIKGAKMQALVAINKMVELTLKYGVSCYGPSSLAAFSVYISRYGDMKLSVKINEMALVMMEKLKGVANEALVVARTFGYSLGYSRPFHECHKQHFRGYSEGKKFGDVEMAGWCINNYIWTSFFMSKPLRTIFEDCKIYVPHILGAGVVECGESLRYIWESVMYLMGEDDESVMYLMGEDGEENSMKLFVDEEVIQFRHLGQYAFRSAAYAYSGDYKKGAEYALKIGDAFQKMNTGCFTCQGEHFVKAVCLYAMARKTNKGKYKKAARAIAQRMRKWVKGGSVNLNHQLLLFDAEEAAIARKTKTASDLYRKGTVLASRSGLIQDNALICERYADFLLNDLGEVGQAKVYAKESRKCFLEWGSERAADNIKTKYFDLFSHPKNIRNTIMSAVPSSISALSRPSGHMSVKAV